MLISAIIVLIVVQPRSQLIQTRSITTPTPKPVIPIAKADQIMSQGSPDGKFTLTMQERKGSAEVTYIFQMMDETSHTQKNIFTKSVPTGTSISIPFNTFSSDNKYLFLKEVTGSQTTYFVLTASGLPITKDVQTIDFSTLFTAKYPNYVITDVTGWAGPTLVVINTNKIDGTIGPSIWFDVASKSFIQLSTRFN